MSNKQTPSIQKALKAAGVEALDPNSTEAEKAHAQGTRISIEGPGDDDLAKLLADTAQFVQALDNPKTGPFEHKEIAFRRLDTGNYVVMAHRS